jgi:branched-chain amino acid transport system substrate-binding protein
MTVEDINDTGGPLGEKIKLFIADEATDPEQAITGARKLVSVNKVNAIIGPFSDGVLAIYSFLRGHEIPVISQWSGSTELDTIGGDYQFRTCPSDSFSGYVVGRFVHDNLGYKKIGMVILNTENYRSYALGIREQFAKLGGTIVSEIIVNPGQTSYRSALRDVRKAEPDLVYLGVGLDEAPIILKEWYQGDYLEPLWLSDMMVQEKLFDLVGKEPIEGAYGAIIASPMETVPYQVFSMKYEAYTGQKPEWYNENAYDAVNLYALAIEAAGEASGKAIAESLRRVANAPGVVVHTFAEGAANLRLGYEINYEGASGSVDLDEFGNTGGGAVITKAKNGEWVTIASLTVAEVLGME